VQKQKSTEMLTQLQELKNKVAKLSDASQKLKQRQRSKSPLTKMDAPELQQPQSYPIDVEREIVGPSILRDS
jgi:hypothetical protein